MRIYKYRKRSERGTSIVEFGFIAPVFMAMSMLIVDVSRALNDYFLLSRVAYESTRLAADTVGLESGSYEEGTGIQAQIQLKLQQRIRELILEYGERLASQSVITTEMDADVSVVKVSLSYSYQPVFAEAFPRFKVQAYSEGPYLYRGDRS